MRYSKLVWIVAAAVGLFSGCNSSMNRRITAHSDTWHSLSEQDQQRLLNGHVRRGDTEEMVQIALGQPDKELPITSLDGQRLTVWLYEELMDSWDGSPFDPTSINHFTSRERSIMFHDGVVVDQKPIAIEDNAKLVEIRVGRAAENMLARLDSVVALTPEQSVKAYEIFAKAKEKLLAFSPNERPAKGMPVRVKMRADIRAVLTAEQQAKYDVTPQYLGGGSTKRG